MIFRGTIGTLTTTNVGKTSNYFYHNPYVGRVLDGYAMGEGISLDNTNDNYSIPKISKSTHLKFNGSAITVNDAEGLWLLSAIANSGSGNLSSAAYKNGKARWGSYQGVGTRQPDETEKADEKGFGGAKVERYSYLASSSFCDGTFPTKLTGDGAFAINLVDNGNYDMSYTAGSGGYGNGFRGIGTSYGSFDNEYDKNHRLIRASGLNGNDSTVTLGQGMNEYLDEKEAWCASGSGFFVQLYLSGNADAELTFQNLTLTGKTGISYYNSTSAATDRSSDAEYKSRVKYAYTSSGMLAASLAKTNSDQTIKFSGIKVENALVNADRQGVAKANSTVYGGGMVGMLYLPNPIRKVTILDCDYSNLTVNALLSVGGLVGYAETSFLTITGADGQNATLRSNSAKVKDYSDRGRREGVGGLIGHLFRKDYQINKVQQKGQYNVSNINLRTLTLVSKADGTKSWPETNMGCLFGLWSVSENGTCNIDNIRVEGKVELYEDTSDLGTISCNAGVIAGYLADSRANSFDDNNAKSFDLTASNIFVAQESTSELLIHHGHKLGGLIGATKNKSGTMTFDGIRIGSAAGGKMMIYNTTDASIQCDGGSASADNCQISAGGLIGWMHWNQNIVVKDTVIEDMLLLSQKYAGGLFGGIQGRTDISLDITRIALNKCKIVANYDPTKAGIGLILGGFQTKNSNAGAVTGRNILIRNSQVGYLLNDEGALFTANTSNPWPPTYSPKLGLYNGTSYTSIGNAGYASCTNGKIGIFAGELKANQNMKLVGVSLRDNQTPAQYFGGTTTGSYVILADYLAATDETAGIYPGVTTSPKSQAGSFAGINASGILTGDGVATCTGASDKTIHIAQKILEEYNGYKSGTISKNQVHFSVNSAMDFLNSFDGTNGKAEIFSTFSAAGENNFTGSTPTDFPVLVIEENDTAAINKLIASYLSIMTDHVEYTLTSDKTSVDKANYSSLFTITPTTYKWDGSAWEAVTNTLKVGTDNQTLSVNKGRYDNQLNQFTLLDVAYADPSGTKEADGITVKKVYHLYIPVVVKKVLLFKVWFSAKEGTDYYTSIYDSQEYAAMASHGDQVTTLITFEYEWNTDEWENALNNGAGLNWNFPKTLQIKDVNSGGIPSGTKLTLVDRNNQNKAYFTTSGGLSPDGNGYISFKLQEQFNGFSEVKLWELLTLNAVESTAEQVGQYVEVGDSVGDSASDTIQIGDKYYRPITEDEKAQETPPTCYYLEVKGFKSETQYAREQYYLTIQTPKTAKKFIYLMLQYDTRLDNPGDGVGLPSTRIDAKDVNLEKPTPVTAKEAGVSLRGDENVIVISNFFKQELTVRTTSSEQLMSDTNRSITGTLKTVISFDEGTGEDKAAKNKENYLRFTGERSLHQCFELYLKSMNNDNGTTVSFDEGASLTVGGKAVPLNGGTRVQVYSEAIKWDESSNSKTVSCDFTLTYTLAGISSQFPIRANDTDEIGIQVNATSKLSYVEDMSQTSMEDSEADETGNLFYQKDLHLATLTYNAYENAYGTQRYGWSQLGINDLDSNGDYQILSAALYDVHELTNASLADKLRISVKLLQKTDGGYVDVSKPLSSYLSYLRVKPKVNPNGDFLEAKDVRNNAAEYSLANTGFNSSVPIEIEVDMNVITGAEFEAKHLTYANYKLVLTAELLDKNGTPIAGSSANDHIIYTNAKIIPTLVS